MRDAAKEDDIEELEKTIQNFENSDLDEKDTDLTMAKQKLAELKKKKQDDDVNHCPPFLLYVHSIRIN